MYSYEERMRVFMISEAFQNIVNQMTDAFNLNFGVIDYNGLVLVSTGREPVQEVVDSFIYSWPTNEDVAIQSGYIIKSISNEHKYEYLVYVEGVNNDSVACCKALAVAISNVRFYYNEKYDKATFMKNIIFDNLMSFDLHQKARELQINAEVPRCVFTVKTDKDTENESFDVLSRMFPKKDSDFVISMDKENIVVIKEFFGTNIDKQVEKTAATIIDTLGSETMSKVSVGVGTVVNNIDNVANSFKEAQVALEVGKVFDTENDILYYNKLGIGRLIYQLPTKLCEMFLSEVFKKGDINSLDDETIITIQKFFENDLNVSEASRQLFVHRNTLVYRLEKIYKITGLDLRKFDQAIVFKVAMMVNKYLISNPMKI